MRYYLIAGAILIIDQLSKFAIKMTMNVGDSISVLGDFFRITYVENTGAAFSMLSGQRVFLILVPLLAITAALWYMRRHQDEPWIFKASMWIIIAGGLGNLIDRIAFGAVTDMFDFSIFPPVFNVADIGVTCGCVLLVIYVFFGERMKKSNE